MISSIISAQFAIMNFLHYLADPYNDGALFFGLMFTCMTIVCICSKINYLIKNYKGKSQLN